MLEMVLEERREWSIHLQFESQSEKRKETIQLYKSGCEPPLGFVKTTKPVLIQAGTSREIHGLTKIKHGGYAVNCISEPAIGQQL